MQVVDVFEALTSKRSYKDPLPPEDALKLMTKSNEMKEDFSKLINPEDLEWTKQKRIEFSFKEYKNRDLWMKHESDFQIVLNFANFLRSLNMINGW